MTAGPKNMANNNIVGDFESVAATKRYIKRKSGIQVGLETQNAIKNSVIRTKLNAASEAVKACYFVYWANLNFSLREFPLTLRLREDKGCAFLRSICVRIALL